MYACKRGRVDVVKLLIDNNADIHAKDGEHQTALMHAQWGGSEDITRLLRIAPKHQQALQQQRKKMDMLKRTLSPDDFALFEQLVQQTKAGLLSKEAFDQEYKKLVSPYAHQMAQFMARQQQQQQQQYAAVFGTDSQH